MSADDVRLQFLLEVIAQEALHLQQTIEHVFASDVNAARVRKLSDNIEDSHAIDAFVARFGRLQDTLADKLLPQILTALAETPGPAIDNLEKAEKLGLIGSLDDWLAARKLRNRMVHEYIRNPEQLAEALNLGRTLSQALLEAADACADMAQQRGWMSVPSR